MIPILTCRDTDDKDYWEDRLNKADRNICEKMLGELIEIIARRAVRGIPSYWLEDRRIEGENIFHARFGENFIPF